MKKSKTILTTICCSLFLLSSGSSVSLSEYSTNTNLYNTSNQNETYDTVVSYKTVLRSYYDLATLGVDNPTKTYDEFYTEFYHVDSDRDLYRFTTELAIENDNYEIFSENFIETPQIRKSSSSSSSADADYILNTTTDYSSTPSSAFKRQFCYYSIYDYSSVKKGDIVWETDTKFFNAGHNALIVNTSKNSSYGTYIQTIESVGSGVNRGFLDDYRMTEYRCRILRVSGRTDSKSTTAINFATQQLGKSYSFNYLKLSTSINTSSWYCSELVYASWKYAGIDIGIKNGNYLVFGCLPSDIANSDNTYQLSMVYYGFLELSIVSKSGNDWKIKISNTSSTSLEVYYNTKMCFVGDAKYWTNLSNVKSTTVGSNAYKTVTISTNWFATSITTSFISGNYRIISYARDLSSSSLTLTSYYSFCEVVN